MGATFEKECGPTKDIVDGIKSRVGKTKTATKVSCDIFISSTVAVEMQHDMKLKIDMYAVEMYILR